MLCLPASLPWLLSAPPEISFGFGSKGFSPDPCGGRDFPLKCGQMKLPKLGINFCKVLAGVGFSLLWARVMYSLWEHPDYITFIWFYLVIGSVILKWVIFTIIDRIHLKIKVKSLLRELDESERRVREALLQKRSKGEK